MQDVLRAAGLLVAMLGVLLQLTSPFFTLMASAAGLLAAGLWVTDRQARMHVGLPLAASLQWDGEQWWWQPAVDAGAGAGAGAQSPNRAPAGEPLANASPAGASAKAPAMAVTPHVLLDGEHWLLLRLVPVGSEARFWRHHCLAVSRRHHASHWSLLRIHLFMART